ncbi:flavin containing amine oxidoreductase [Nitzschia inconspicua]|uniref:monoamine oxidase n=1 Tax=Nitzschia inconspicua TaxID=303405 RepID=A0A9K3LPD0_9STRA|nr:flavin containing amine oxidoreductase [Nitzschia inconspicua]KAG7364096.1 flavin containing amine oxidoreductase [Nitzschia inconspicua]
MMEQDKNDETSSFLPWSVNANEQNLQPSNSSGEEKIWDVIILGAGQAGMAAAHRLVFEHEQQHQALRLLILEASDHVGGRTRNFDLSTGQKDVISDDVIEMGGTWLSPEHSAVLDLCQQQLGLEVFKASFLSEPSQQLGTIHQKERITNNNDPKSRPREDPFEFPWWFLGPDYSDEEMERLGRIVVHQSGIENDSTKTVAVSNPIEFLESFNLETIQQLEKVGIAIESDTASAFDTTNEYVNVWELPAVGIHWHELDSASTAKERSFLSRNSVHQGPPLLTELNARNILRGVVHNKNADEPDNVSYLYNLISWSGANSKGPDMEFRVRGGTQAIPLTIAKNLKEDSGRHEVKLNLDSPVKSVQRNSSSIGGAESDSFFLVTTNTGEIYRSKTLLVTGSPAALREIQFGTGESSLLPRIQTALLSPESSPMGRCLKFCAIYHRGPWWRKFNLQGDIISSGLPKELSVEVNSTDGCEADFVPLFSYCFDVSPYSRKFGVLCCFVEGVAYDDFQRFTIDERKSKMTDFVKLSFEKFLKETASYHDDSLQRSLWVPDDFACFEWGAKTSFIGGAYTSYFPPRVLTRLDHWQGYQQVEKSHNLFWAGADYHAGYGNGYIEGAVRGGQRAADLILERLSDPGTA